MQVVEIRRYPVKSMLGERLQAAEVGERGLTGDRLWAVRDPDGKFGSGKNTRRFRRMPGLFGFRAYAAPGELPDGRRVFGATAAFRAPVVELPDGRCFAADDPAGHRAISEALGRMVTLSPEGAVAHHDEGPVSLITTAGLRRLTGLTGGGPDGSEVDPARFRANLLIDVPGNGFPEDDWPGRRLRVGPDVVLRPVRPLTRCVMIDQPQDRAPDRNDLLKTLAARHDMTFGVFAVVERPGRVSTGDACVWA